MKRFFTVILIIFLFSCKESGIQIAKPSTFVRYFNSGSPDYAIGLLETTDNGFLVLANSQTTQKSGQYYIKLIKTDFNGNLLWEKLFPSSPGSPNYKAHGFTAIPGNGGKDSGYLIVGEEINSDPTKAGLLMIRVDQNGTSVATSTITSATIGSQVQGAAVAYTDSLSNDVFFVTGNNLSDPINDIFYGKFDGSLNPVWYKTAGQGSADGSSYSLLTNRIVLDTAQSSGLNFPVFRYGETQVINGQGQIIFDGIERSTHASIKPYGYPASMPTDTSFSCSDFAHYGAAYGFIGGYSGIGSSSFDGMFLALTNNDGSYQYGVKVPTKNSLNVQNDGLNVQTGNSICQNRDGGVTILGTISNDATSADTDYWLYKFDLTSKKMVWQKQLGGKSRDIGCRILPTNDGGYVILGTTVFTNLETICLIKTDGEGEIQ